MNKLWAFFKRPKGAFLAVVYFLTVVFSALSVFLAIITADTYNALLQAISYLVYALAAVLLFYAVYAIVLYAPRLKESVTDFLQNNKFTKKIMESYGYKTTLFSLFSTAITLTVVAMNVVSAVRYKRFWFAALAGYYLTLLIFRGMILFFNDRRIKSKTSNEKGKIIGAWKIYLFVGAFLVLLELSMAVVVTTMLRSKRPTDSGEILAISTAAYAFYKMGMAIYNVFKARRFKLPVAQAIRNVNFADACMSIFSLTVLLTETFGETTNVIYIKAITGFGCLASVIAVASIMIVRANKNIKRLIGDTYER